MESREGREFADTGMTGGIEWIQGLYLQRSSEVFWEENWKEG